jgi:hypothetical protein
MRDDDPARSRRLAIDALVAPPCVQMIPRFGGAAIREAGIAVVPFIMMARMRSPIRSASAVRASAVTA